MYISIIDFATPQFSELVALRDLVLRQPLGMEFEASDLSEEFDSIHLGCYSDRGVLLGCLVFKPLAQQIVKMRQVAVFPKYRSSGVGSFLVSGSEVIAKSYGFSKITLSARLPAVRFYERLNYNKIGDIYTEVGIDHLKMWKQL